MVIQHKAKRSRDGQGLVEYAIIISLVAIVCIVVLGLVGLAVSRGYGLIAGALGAKKEIRTDQYHVYFDTNPPQCGTILDPSSALYGHKGFYAQFYSDITDQSLFTVATDTGLIPHIEDNGSTDGSGNWKIDMDLTVLGDLTCPTSLVLQTPKSMGGNTLAYPVVHQDWLP